MKIFYFLLLSLYTFVPSGNARLARRAECSNLNPTAAKELAKILSLVIVNRIQEKTNSLHSNKIPVIPELPEEEQLPDIHLEFKPDSPLSPLIVGELNFCDSYASNLSTIKDDFTMGPEGPQVYALYRLDVGDVALNGLHSHALRLLGSTTFTEFGVYEIALKAGYFGMEMHIEVNIVHGNITFHQLILDAGFESLALSSDESYLNGEKIDWDDVNSQIKPIFDEVWAGLKNSLEPLLPAIFNLLFKDCTISDLLNGRFECIGLGKDSMSPVKMLEESILNILNFQVYDIEQCQNPKTVPSELTTTEESHQSTTDNGTPGETTTEGSNQSTTDNGIPGETTTEGNDSTATNPDQPSSSSPTSEGPGDSDSGSESIFINFYSAALLLSVIYYI